MPRAKAKATYPLAKHSRRNAVVPKTQEPAPVSPVKPTRDENASHAAPPDVPQSRKRVVRRPKYHETARFLERESFKGLGPTDEFVPPAAWFPGVTLGESYRVATTMFRAAQQASLETRPVSWGYGSTDGALGHNNTRRVVEIKRLAIFRRAVVRSVSAGNRLSLFLTDDGRVFQSGRLFMKQDGCAMWRPVEVALGESDSPSIRPTFVAVEAGHLAAYALDDHGRVYSWGTQIFGQLGHGEELEPEAPDHDSDEEMDVSSPNGDGDDESEQDTEEETPPKIVIVEKTPRRIEALAGHAVVKVSSGNHFVVAISTTGAVFSWGRGCFGQLGNGSEADVSSPGRVDALADYIALDIAAGKDHVLSVCIVRESSNQQDEEPAGSHHEASVTEHSVVMAWGRGQHGCLGFGGSCNELLPRENTFFRGLGATKVAAGAGHSLVLCSVGARTFLYSFGDNRLGQLGVASNADHVDMPSFLDEFVNVHVASIGAGAQYCTALTGDGEVFTWGDARYGKTCRADGRTTYVPWKIDLPSNIPSSSFVAQLSVGMHHTLAQLRIGGEVDRWRKFPLGPVAPALCHQEQNSKVSVCSCKSSQTTTRSVLGIFVQCETCRVSPVCRACCRRCHAGHTLLPVAIGREQTRNCVCAETTQPSACVFAATLPPLVQEEA